MDSMRWLLLLMSGGRIKLCRVGPSGRSHAFDASVPGFHFDRGHFAAEVYVVFPTHQRPDAAPFSGTAIVRFGLFQ